MFYGEQNVKESQSFNVRGYENLYFMSQPWLYRQDG